MCHGCFPSSPASQRGSRLRGARASRRLRSAGRARSRRRCWRAWRRKRGCSWCLSTRPRVRCGDRGRGPGARGHTRGLRSVLSAGDREKGEMGLAAVPGRQAAFREGLEQAVLYAKALGCPRYLSLSSPSMTQDPSARGSGSKSRGRLVLRSSGV